MSELTRHKNINPVIKDHYTDELRLIAKTPAQLAFCQESLMEWGVMKVEQARTAIADAKETLTAAKEAGMQTAKFKARVNREKKRMEYYDKLLGAFKLGYYIVPDFFNGEIIAIRTDNKKPSGRTTKKTRWTEFVQSAKRLALGQGRYVSPDASIATWSEGEEVYCEPDNFMPVDFPFSLIRPEIIKATKQAMDTKIFDRISVVPQSQAADPMVVGSIIHPTNAYKEVNFLVGWWLDTESLN